jgi:DNA helicase HerA-like ATPase
MTKEDDRRVPTFVVVDEAHNVLPSAPRGKTQEALSDLFRRIAAEGRKFGLFLVFVSQRPDKLDPLIVSECENKAVMKLGSKRVLEATRTMLGLEEVDRTLLEKGLGFKTGRALMIGNWAPNGPEVIYGAARRTVAGGGNLNASYWAVPS